MKDLGGRALRHPPADRQMRGGREVKVTRATCVDCGAELTGAQVALHLSVTGHHGVQVLAYESVMHAR